MKKNFYLIIVLTLSVLFVQANTQSVLWSENFEGDWTANWHVDAGTWEVGEPTSGPNAAYNGDNCAATVLGGNYTEPVTSRLIRHSSFTVPSASQNPRLLFWHWYSFSTSDYGKVQIKVVGTDVWDDVSTSYTNTGSNIWSYPFIDLSAYAGQSIQIAFYFNSHNYAGGSFDVSSGWYIDDVQIETGPIVFNNPENWENGIGHWASERGTWEVGTPTSGPGSAHNGVKCAATVLSGNYAEPVESKLISPTYLVPAASENPRLRFWHWYSFSTSDYGKVQIKVVGTDVWDDVSTSYTNTGSNIWSYPFIDLSAYAGQSIQIAFYFNSHNYAGGSFDVSSGWYIDDIIVEYDTQLSTENNIQSFSFGIPPQTASATINPTTHSIEVEVEDGTDLSSLVAEFTLSDGATAKVENVVQESGVTANDFSIPVTYTVTAEDGTTVQDWVVTVTVAPNTETEILEFSFGIPPQTGAASIYEVNHTVDIEVESGTDLTNLVASFTLSSGATAKVGGVAQASGTTSNDFSSPVTYTVTAEDGATTQDWVVTVTEEVVLNDETDILAYSFGIPPQTGTTSIYEVNHTIDIEVEAGTDVTGLVATFTLSSGATAEVGGVAQTSGSTSNDFSSPVTYTIIAEDGTTEQDWIVTVTEEVVLNNETDILTFSFGIPPQTGAASINAVNHTVDIEVESGTDLTSLVATFMLSSGATAVVGGEAQTSGTTSNDFTSPVTYTITAEDGTTEQDWVITVTVAAALNNETDILSFSFGIPPQTGAASINAVNHTVDIEVESGTDLTSLVATFALSSEATAEVGGVAQTSGATSNDFSSPVTYLITAENGTTEQEWVVTVSEEIVLNSETDILTFSFGIPPQTGNATINFNFNSITIEVEYGTDLINLIASFSLSEGASAKVGDVVQESGVTANNFTNPVTITVTADDGTTVQNWVVTVSFAPNTETEILEYGFGMPPQTGVVSIDATAHTINIGVEYGTDLTSLVAEFALSEGASAKVGDDVQESGVTANDYSNPVTYLVIAEDGTTAQEWVVTVSVAVNTETEILEFGFGIPPQTGASVINPDTWTIQIEVESETDLTNLIATFTLSEGATAKIGDIVQENGVTSNDFSSLVIYTVIAEDGTTVQEWNILVDRITGSDEIYLRNLKIYPNPFSESTTIEFSNPKHSNCKMALYNILGKKVLEMDNVTSDKIILKRGTLKTGLYLVELRGEQTFNNQLIIVK